MIKNHLDKEAAFMAWCEEEAKRRARAAAQEYNTKSEEDSGKDADVARRGDGTGTSTSTKTSTTTSNNPSNGTSTNPTRLMTSTGPETDSQALRRLGLAAFSKMKQAEISARRVDVNAIDK